MNLRISALATLVLLAILLVGCGDDAKPKGSNVFVPGNNTNNSNSNNANSSNSNNIASNGSESNNSLECEEGVCELDCAVFADPNFCWNQARAQTYACMNDQVRGIMNPSGDVCTVGDVSIEFAAAIDASALADIEDWDFQIIRDGQTCAQITNTDKGLTLNNVFFEVDETEYRIECEDGAIWTTTDFEALFTCVDEQGFLNLPGTTSFSAGPEFGFGLLPGSSNLFQCTFE